MTPFCLTVCYSFLSVKQLYCNWIHAWEERLSTLDTNRVVRPFDWGLDWVRSWPLVNGNFPAGDPAAAEQFLHHLNQAAVARSDELFSYQTPSDFRLERRKVERFSTRAVKEQDGDLGYGDFLRFTSPVRTPYPENDLANARWFPARGRRAVVVLPNWNADALNHNALCRVFNLLGIATLRLSMPYHDIRKPAETDRADYAVSANLGRTLDAGRQAVIDVRCCLDWLQMQGYTRLGLLGTSLGSCYAFLAAAHDARVRLAVFNHASTYFADVVWNGATTHHIRTAAAQHLSLESLRQSWLAISPASYFGKFARWPRKSLVIYGSLDTTFPPDLSRHVVQEFNRRGLDHKTVVLPCGHYTIGESPYKFLDGYHMAAFLRTAF